MAKFPQQISKSVLSLPLSSGGKMTLEERFLYAAKTNNVKELTKCLEMGVNVNAVLDDGLHDHTALIMAAERGDLPLAIKLATKKQLDYNCQTIFGITPLIISGIIRKRKFAVFLLKNGSDPNLTDRLGKGPLHYASLLNYLDMAILFVRYGADVSAVDCFGRTPLSLALLENCSPHMARFLLNHGSQFDKIKTKNNLPLFLECVLGCHDKVRLEGVKLLLTFGADVNMIDLVAKRNALHYVAITGFDPLAEVLLSLGGDYNHRDYTGMLPIELARIHRNKRVYLLLADFGECEYNYEELNDPEQLVRFSSPSGHFTHTQNLKQLDRHNDSNINWNKRQSKDDSVL